MQQIAPICILVNPTNISVCLKNIYVPNVELNGKTLELIKREKYLGFFVTDSFYDDEYIKN